ncbi:hypothetical protein BZA05DRAFT_348577 [Tricharina praecox]|uniref:uncharacterized protein n=1 Tax=Tricharina praecox TaxID=43433 RepID=UPI002220E13F|nr:uncharacterized protein BZA05DRAFT_348577 [Tricharina praecox]KAI5856265.1 hypothetical protein BZA05DRAFT_348577 [Tricharina praecox]
MQTVSGLTRTAHFTYNVGAQYNYVANQPTVIFEEVHPVVRRARELLTLRVQMLYPDVEFNEVLNVGYLENQKINFHQDGEKGLGPTFTSISLGCPAIMEFRIKATNDRRQHADWLLLEYQQANLPFCCVWVDEDCQLQIQCRRAV